MLSPTTLLDTRYGDGSTPTSWDDAVAILDTAEIFWISTVRPTGGPHVTPMIAAWVDDALYFITGLEEQKARNIRQQAQVTITTGTNLDANGLDIVVEGTAEPVHDAALLARVAERYAAKYDWHFSVKDGTLVDDSNHPATVFRVNPSVAYGFSRGPYSQTRWTF